MSHKKFALFVSIPFVGHLNPLLRQSEELARRGWRVAVASAQEVQAYVEADPCCALGVEFINLGSIAHLQDDYSRFREKISHEKSFLKSSFQIVDSIYLLWTFFFDGLLKVVRQERPDILIVDFVTRAALDVSEVEGIAAIVNNPCLVTAISVAYLPPANNVPLPYSAHSIHHLPWHARWSYPLLRWFGGVFITATVGRKLNQLRATRGLGQINVNDAWAEHPVMVNSAFGLEYPRPLAPNITMVGPMLPATVEALPEEIEDWLTNGPAVVYVNLGTITMMSPHLIECMYNAFAHAPFRVWWILRPQTPESLSQPLHVNPNLRIDAWGPPLMAVLKHPNVRVFVSHCGINSVQESLAAGTPIVGIPMFADQFDMAMRVKDAGVGLFVNKSTLSAPELRAKIECILADATFLRPIPGLQKSFAEAGGVTHAADLIEQAAAQTQQK